MTAETAGDKPTDAELAAALASGGTTAVDALKKAYETLKKGDVWQMILKEGGQLLLDFIGVTDLMDCVTKGNVGSCIMLVAGALPIGKLAKLGKIVALLTKIAPKIVNHATAYARALETIAGMKGKAKTIPTACPSVGVASCRFPAPTGGNPGINPAKGTKTSPNDIGKYGEAWMNSSIEQNPGKFGISDMREYESGTRTYASLLKDKQIRVDVRRADGYTRAPKAPFASSRQRTSRCSAELG